MLICKFFTLISLAFNHLHLILGIFTITQIDAEPKFISHNLFKYSFILSNLDTVAGNKSFE